MAKGQWGRHVAIIFEDLEAATCPMDSLSCHFCIDSGTL